jgi:hypothetical protein
MTKSGVHPLAVVLYELSLGLSVLVEGLHVRIRLDLLMKTYLRIIRTKNRGSLDLSVLS